MRIYPSPLCIWDEQTPLSRVVARMRGGNVLAPAKFLCASVVPSQCGLADAIQCNQISPDTDAAELLRSDGGAAKTSSCYSSRVRARDVALEILLLLQRVCSVTWTIFQDMRTG